MPKSRGRNNPKKRTKPYTQFDPTPFRDIWKAVEELGPYIAEALPNGVSEVGRWQRQLQASGKSPSGLRLVFRSVRASLNEWSEWDQPPEIKAKMRAIVERIDRAL